MAEITNYWKNEMVIQIKEEPCYWKDMISHEAQFPQPPLSEIKYGGIWIMKNNVIWLLCLLPPILSVDR